jgi:hypothetical protein
MKSEVAVPERQVNDLGEDDSQVARHNVYFAEACRFWVKLGFSCCYSSEVTPGS